MDGFVDQVDAGRQLAARLASWRGRDVVVAALPRGGVPVAYEVALSLGAPLEILVVRKIGVPHQPEVAMGALGEDGVVLVHHDVVRAAGVDRERFDDVERRERDELARRVELYRGSRPPADLRGRTVLLVDDGVATGATARVAARVARARGAIAVVLVTPVVAADAVASLREDIDEVIAVIVARGPFAVGQWYQRFDQTTDEEVLDDLGRAARRFARPRDDEPWTGPTEVVDIVTSTARLEGHLSVPDAARTVVLVAHTGAHEALRDLQVTESLNRRGHATLLLDLLVGDEARDRTAVDAELLARRLVEATTWVGHRVGDDVALGYLGAGVGAAAALRAAAGVPPPVAAVVSLGGRVDLAGDHALERLRVPTLLIVGGDDPFAVTLTSAVRRRLTCENRVVIVPGATHLFSEPGAMEQAAELAGDWFDATLSRARRVGARDHKEEI
ncbi:MAG: phosphoribosyltransferase family protein [Acidimicrobiales bacterium]